VLWVICLWTSGHPRGILVFRVTVFGAETENKQTSYPPQGTRHWCVVGPAVSDMQCNPRNPVSPQKLAGVVAQAQTCLPCLKALADGLGLEEAGPLQRERNERHNVGEKGSGEEGGTKKVAPFTQPETPTPIRLRHFWRFKTIYPRRGFFNNPSE